MPFKPLPKVRRSLPVREFYEEFREPLQLRLVAGEEGLDKEITEQSVNRPALALTGYFKSLAVSRLQLFGAGEMSYLREQESDHQIEVLTRMATMQVPCFIVSRNLAPTKTMLKVATEYAVPLLRSTLSSREFSTSATLLMESLFAPRVSEHGTLLDVKGIGVLIRGKSGVGKSECALALIERGHSLVADDIVHIRLLDGKELLGESSKLNRGYMECRGLGIINITELFGIRAVRIEKRIDMVVTFEDWTPDVDEDRTGLEEEFYEILDQQTPHIRLPVRPGRDLARLVEVAAMVQALKFLGHHSAREFNERLIKAMSEGGHG